MADEVSNIEQPGVRAMVDNLMSRGDVLTPEKIVDGCVELLGYVFLKDENRQELIEQIRNSGEVSTRNPEDVMFAEKIILRTMSMVGSTREYQFA